MKKKIICSIICMLLFTTSISTIGCTNEIITSKAKILNYNLVDEFVAGEFIIKFSDDTIIESSLIKTLNEKYRVYSVEKIFKNKDDTIIDNIYIMKVPINSNILNIIREYASCPGVLYAEPNGIFHPCAIPNDPDFNKQWALDNTGQTGGTPDADIDATEVWDIETGDSDVVIAIIDSGIDYNHPDLIENIWINDNEIPDNGIDDDENDYIDDVMGWDWSNDDNDPLDGLGHGTICAGIAGAVGNNGIGISGICWDCNLMTLQVFDENGFSVVSDIIKAIEYAGDNNADIISMSMEGYVDYSSAEDVIDYVYYNKGVTIVASAGNSNTSSKSYPAAYDNVIAVAGTDHNDSRMNYYYEPVDVWCISNYGDWVDVAAPGQEIYSTMPTYQVTYNNILGWTQNYTHGIAGTSASCPYVAGVIALMLSKHDSLSQDEIKSSIREYVDPYDSEVYIGTGRINAHRATKIKTYSESKDYSDRQDLSLHINRIFNIKQIFQRFFEKNPILFQIIHQIYSY